MDKTLLICTLVELISIRMTSGFLFGCKDPCAGIDYINIDDFRRDINFVMRAEPHEHGNCDISLAEGWYRFYQDKKDAMMPTNCVTHKRCGSFTPMWLDLQGQSMPDKGKEVLGRACGVYEETCCKYQKTNVKVKNCGSYYIYYLLPAGNCKRIYCTQVNA